LIGATIEKSQSTALEIGKGQLAREGKQVVIFSFGTLLSDALIAAESLNATVCDMRWIKPLDESLILTLSQQHRLVVTLEDSSIAGGAGSAVSEYLSSQGIITPVLQLGLPVIFSN